MWRIALHETHVQRHLFKYKQKPHRQLTIELTDRAADLSSDRTVGGVSPKRFGCHLGPPVEVSMATGNHSSPSWISFTKRITFADPHISPELRARLSARLRASESIFHDNAIHVEIYDEQSDDAVFHVLINELRGEIALFVHLQSTAMPLTRAQADIHEERL